MTLDVRAGVLKILLRFYPLVESTQFYRGFKPPNYLIFNEDEKVFKFRKIKYWLLKFN